MPRRQTLLSLTILAAVVLAWFSPWWAAGRFLAPLDLQNRMMSPWSASATGGFAKNHYVADGIDQYLVYRLIAERDFKREGRVGWSSLNYGGTAQYANTMALYSDWTVHLHRWFDFKSAWHLGLLGQVLIAAYGMYFFLRGREIGETWSVCGALLWAANSQFVTWIYHRWTLGSFCWVPWILWAIDGFRNGKRGMQVLVPVFLALSFLGGTLQHAALVVLVVGAAWLESSPKTRTVAANCVRRCARIGTKVLPSRSGARRAPLQGGSSAVVPLWRFAVWGLLGVGLAGFMFVPSIAAFLESNRLGLHTGTHGLAPGWYPYGPLQPVLNLASYPLHAFPSLLGRCDSLDILKLFRSELFYVAFFGTIPAVVAVRSMAKRDLPLLAKCLVVIGLLLPLTPLVRYLYQRLLLLYILGGTFAFAWFMSRSLPREKARIAKWLGIATTAGVILWSAASVVVSRPGVSAALKEKAVTAAAGSSFGHYRGWLEARADRFIDGLAIWSPTQSLPLALLAVGIVALAMAGSSRRTRRKVGSLVLATVAVLEVSVFASRWVTWSDFPMFAETSETRILRDEVGPDGRTTTVIHPTSHMALTPFVPNTLAAYGIASIHGYDSIVPDGMLLPFETPDDARRLGRLGVSHLITWHGNPDIPADWKRVSAGEAMDLYQNPLAMPRYAGFSGADSLLAFHEGGTFHGSPLEETSGRENSRRIPVPDGITILRIAENAAPGWRWRMNGGAWSDVPRGPDACMEIEIPPSPAPREVELVYSPPLRTWGWSLTAGSFACLLAGAVAAASPRPRTQP